MKLRLLHLLVLSGLVGLYPGGAAAQNVWLQTGTNDWFGNTSYWSLGHFPQAGEDGDKRVA